MSKRLLKKELKKCIVNAIGEVFYEMEYTPIIKQTSKTIVVTHYFTNTLSMECENIMKTGDIYFSLFENNEKIFGISSIISLSNFSKNCNVSAINKMVKQTIKSLIIYTISEKSSYIETQIKYYLRKNKIKNLLWNSPLES